MILLFQIDYVMVVTSDYAKTNLSLTEYSHQMPLPMPLFSDRTKSSDFATTVYRITNWLRIQVDRMEDFMICPKCGMEFKEGVLVCSDCGTDLVERLEDAVEEMTDLIHVPSDYATRLNDFLEYSRITTQLTQAEEEGHTLIRVKESQKAEAVKLASVFLTEEPPEPSDDEEEEDEAERILYAPSGIHYKTAQTRYEEAKSTGITFAIFSVALLLDVLDNAFTHFLPAGNLLMNIVFTSLKTLEAAISTEADNKAVVETWLNELFPDLAALDAKTLEQFGEISMEEQELNRMQYLNHAIHEQFPELDPVFLEYEAENYFNQLEEM